MATLTGRLKHAWNAFTSGSTQDRGGVSGHSTVYGGGRPDRVRLTIGNERSIISSIYTRIGIDVSGVSIRHVRTDKAKRYVEDIDSELQNCLTVQPNIDQGPRQFRQDIAMTLFERGVAAICPIDTTLNPNLGGGWDIKSMRVGWIVNWEPEHVRVSVYNEKVGLRQEIRMAKSAVAIVENPLYSVMNEPNSTLQRLIAKLALLDVVDKQSASGKLDLIIQLPYVIKSESKRAQAEQRRKDIEFQLKDSQYGIAYTDGTEKITQLNRPAENNLMTQIEYLTKMLYSQLGLTEEVMDGTADEAAMLNYNNRTLEPILDAIVEAMRRSFLTKTARTQGQSVMYFDDPFKLVPVAQLAEIADKFTRNEIVSSNEFRGVIGFAPSDDPKADQLVNSNMPQTPPGADPALMDQAFDEIEAELDSALAEFDVESTAEEIEDVEEVDDETT